MHHKAVGPPEAPALLPPARLEEVGSGFHYAAFFGWMPSSVREIAAFSNFKDF